MTQAKTISFGLFLKQSRVPPPGVAALLVDMSLEEVKAHVLENSLLEQELYDAWLERYNSIIEYLFESTDAQAVKLIPEAFCRLHLCVAVEKVDGVITVAAANPFDMDLESQLKLVLHQKMELQLGRQDQILEVINTAFEQDSHLVRLARTVNVRLIEEHSQFSVDVVPQANSTSVTQLVDILLSDALRLGATDIHIEKSRFSFMVRYRVGGTLFEKATLPLTIADVVLRRLLVLSDGNINERLMPQDTSFEFSDGEVKKTSVRMSVLYTTNGFSIVLRLLMAAEQYSDLALYVKDPLVLQMIRDFLHSLNGMLIVTGPTSSGKTTTLYSAIAAVNTLGNKIITMEDPVEAEIPGLNQVEVQPDVGLDFAQVIKTSVRQNPNVLLLGEVRDQETAVMVMRAAITGVMVLTTLHTKNVTSTVLRLLDLGADMMMIANAVKMIVTQRLARLICPHCKKKYEPTVDEQRILKSLNLKIDLKKKTFYKGIGCMRCRQTGYLGVEAVFEAFKFNEAGRTALNANDLPAFKQVVMKELNGCFLIDNILKLCLDGRTTIEELIKLAFD